MSVTFLTNEDKALIDKRVDALSEEIAAQGVSPESFGAAGDGVTDDAAAIAQALASSKNVVFDGTKTYAVGSVVTIPADSFVDFRGATIVPQGNHDVIQMKPGAHIENLIVKCTGVSDWDSSAIVFYGGDMFRGSSPTQLNNVKLYNAIATKGGNGLYLYADEEGQFVEGIAAVDVSTSGFTHGVHMHGKLPDGESLPSIVFTGSDKIQLNPDSSYMFANDGTNASFSALASITGTEMWVANKGTIMDRVCVKNERITQPVCIPAGVTYMSNAFAECYKLTTPPELPDGLLSLSTAFAQCIALQYLPELPSTVTNIEYAFLSCRAATKAPSVVPGKTMKMTAAFRNCQNIDGTIEVNATNVSNYDLCFLDTCKTSGSITLTGSSPYLAQLAATNTEGKVTVAS